MLPAPTGTSRRILEYARALSPRFSVAVLSIKLAEQVHVERVHGARLLRVPVGSGDFASRLQAFDRAVRRQLESEDYVLAHFMDPFAGSPLCELRDRFGYRLIYDAQTFPSAELEWLEPELADDASFVARLRRSELFCLMNADRVLCGSEATRAFIHSLGVAKRQVDVVRTPIDLAAVPFAPPSSSAGRLRLTYVGSDAPWQGLRTLLRAIAIASRDADVRLTVIGPARREAHEPQLRRLALQQRVEFHPPVPGAELAALVARSDAAALPLEDVARNRAPGGPCSKVADYLAAGRAIVASDLPIAREFVPGEAATFHPAGDVDAIAAALVELAWDPKLRAKMGAAAREAAAPHDSGTIQRRLAAIYEEEGAAILSGASSGSVERSNPSPAALVLSSWTLPTASAAPSAPPPTPEIAPPGAASLAEIGPTAPRSEAVPLAQRSLEATSPDPAQPSASRDSGTPTAQVSALPVQVEMPDHTQDAERGVHEHASEPHTGARLDPWFTQVVHGYCPPDAAAFAHPAPPTNFPGRAGPPPPTVQPPPAGDAPSFTPRTTGG